MRNRYSVGELETTEQLARLKEQLADYKLVKGLEEEIVNVFWRTGMYDSLIAQSRFLEQVIEYVKESRPRRFNRFKFYEYLADNLITAEADRNKVSNAAFVMELMQVLSLTKPRLVELLGAQLTEELIRTKLLVSFEGGYKFVHFSLHSYFAAQKLKSLKSQQEFLASLISENGEYLPFPNNWYDVLTYYFGMDGNQRTKDWFIQTLLGHQELVDEGILNVLSFTISSFKLTQQKKMELFNFLLRTYMDKAIWFPDSAEKLLAFLASEDSVSDLIEILSNGENDSENNFVTKGNIVGVIDEIIKSRPRLLGNRKEIVHDLLISLANDTSENGVLQRRSAHALQGFKRAGDVERIISMANHKDSMVREAFIIFAYMVAPNKKTTIQQLVAALATGADIYARYGIYAISSETGIKYFYSILGAKENSRSLQKFLQHESIFNDKGGRRRDDKILDLTRRKLNDSLLILIKDFIWRAINTGDGYYTERSYFIDQLIGIVLSRDPDFGIELANRVGEGDRYYRVIPVVARLANKNNLVNIVNILAARTNQFLPAQITFQLLRSGAADLYDVAVDAGLIEYAEVSEDSAERLENDEAQKTVKRFIHALEPKEGQYMTDVFEIYNNDSGILNDAVGPVEMAKFKKLVKEIILDKFEPEDITLKINNPESPDSMNYTISQVAHYYGEVLKAGVSLFGDEFVVSNYRNKIVHYLPFTYNDDRSYLLSLIAPLNASDLHYLSGIYANKKSDLRYYLPDAYLDSVDSAIKEGYISNRDDGLEATLRSIINDSRIRIYNRETALDLLAKVVPSGNVAFKTFLKTMFKKYADSANEGLLAIAANSLLITKYDNDDAARWRFEEVKRRAAPFVMKMGMHNVTAFEDELHDKKFGRPLTELSVKYVDSFIELLDCSLDILKTDTVKYMNYANYIWTLSYEYFANLAKYKSDKPLKILDGWYARNGKSVEGANWFENRLEELRKVYSSELTKLDSFDDAMRRLQDYDDGGE